MRTVILACLPLLGQTRTECDRGYYTSVFIPGHYVAVNEQVWVADSFRPLPPPPPMHRAGPAVAVSVGQPGSWQFHASR